MSHPAQTQDGPAAADLLRGELVELLYVVEFAVTHSDEEPPGPTDSTETNPASVYERVVEHLVSWQTHGMTDAELTRASLETSGSLQVKAAAEIADTSDHDVATHPDTSLESVDRRLVWEHLATGSMRYLKLTARTATGVVGNADFVCEVTLHEQSGGSDGEHVDQPDQVRLRIELGREALDEVLAPTGLRFFRRPFLLIKLTGDRSLQLTSAGERVDGRFSWANAKNADSVWDSLQVPRRMPVLLVDGGGPHGDRLAWRAAGELAGLASVRCLDRRVRSALEARLQSIGASVPNGGARLVWPNLDLRHPSWGQLDPDETTARLLRMLAGLSVPARGTNELARSAARSVRLDAARKHDEALEKARQQGDLAAQVAVHEDLIAALRAQEESWLEEIAALENERDLLRTQAAMVEYWKERAEEAWDGATRAPEDLNDAPALMAGDLEELAQFLTEHSDGAIAFTPAAGRSWRRDRYPKPEAMREALLTLARAAIEYRRLECRIPLLSDDWFKQVWGLAMASTDQYMSKHKMDRFEHEGTSHSRLPHIKLDDRVAPSEVGRIYFAMDAVERRFIVDHVGLKLHGL